MNKEGSLLDAAPGVIILVLFLISTLFLSQVLTRKFADNTLINSTTTSKNIMTNTNKYFETTADNLVVLLWAGMVIAGIVTALLTPTLRIMFFFNILIIIILMIVPVMAMQYYSQFEDQPQFADIIQFYPKTHFLMEHLMLFTLVALLAIGMAQWAGHKKMPEMA